MLPLGWGSPQYQYSLGNKGLKAMLWRLLLEENLDMSWLCALAAQNPAVEMGLVGRDREMASPAGAESFSFKPWGTLSWEEGHPFTWW